MYGFHRYTPYIQTIFKFNFKTVYLSHWTARCWDTRIQTGSVRHDDIYIVYATFAYCRAVAHHEQDGSFATVTVAVNNSHSRT